MTTRTPIPLLIPIVLIAALVFVMLESCASNKVTNIPIEVAEPTQFPEVEVRHQSAVEMVQVPESAAWMSEMVETPFQRELRASSALYVLAPAVRFDFDIQREDPLVNIASAGGKNLLAHIDMVCTLADWAWSIDHGVLVVHNTITRTFDIHAPPGESVNRVAPGALAGEKEGTEATIATFASNGYNELAASLQQLMSEEVEQRQESSQLTIDNSGALSSRTSVSDKLTVRIKSRKVRITIVESAGQIIALAPPSVMQLIANVVAEFNARINRRVELEFVLYEVDVTDTAARSLDINLLRQAAIAAGVTVNAPTNTDTALGTGDLRLYFYEGNSIAGSNLILRWLNSQGNTTVSVRKKVVALHNQVTSLRDVQTTRYVALVSLEQQALGGNTSSVTPKVEVDELLTGETWAVLPTIDEDRVYLRLAVSRAALLGFTDYEVGNNTISGSLPQSASRTVGLPISLADGETRLITNLSATTRNEQKSRSPLLAWLPFLGSARDDQTRRIESVISMTARILQD